MSDSETINDRLKWLLSDLKIGKTDFAKSINVDGGQWGKVLGGKMNITLKQILDISSTYHVRTGWLIDGELPVYKKEKSGALKQPDLYLLALMKKQVDELKVNFDTLLESPPDQTLKNHDPRKEYERLDEDTHQKAGKR